MQANDTFRNWLMHIDRRLYAILVGMVIGALGGIIAILFTVLSPVIAAGLVLGALAGVFILMDVYVALYALIGVLFLLPFGTFPYDIGFTPTLLDMVIGAFLLVYLFQWMKHQRQSFDLTPVHVMISIYMLWLGLSFALGLRHSSPTINAIRQFTGTLLSIGLVFVITDLLRDEKALRRLVLVVMIAIGIQAFIALGLYALPDRIAETILIRLSRIGYPDSGVIRYIESNPALPERAIGTWVDPNAFGGVLAVSAVLLAPQIFAVRPVLRYRWLTLLVLGMVVLTLILSFSRASMLAMAIGLSFIAFIRYRRFIPFLIAAAMLMLLLPQTQAYVERFVQAFNNADLATQMRVGEYTDSLRLIQRYPVFGVGFTGTPDIDIYTDVASMYLIMANQIGLVGLTIYLITIGSVFLYGLHSYQYARHNDELASIHLGYHAALFTALVNAVADLYFFRLDFQGPITLFWITVALALASSRLTLRVAKASQSSQALLYK